MESGSNVLRSPFPILPSGQHSGQTPGVRLQGPPGQLHAGEEITDELDVMRGRMVLLAALRDMEERGEGGVPPSQAAPGGIVGTRDDFFTTGMH